MKKIWWLSLGLIIGIALTVSFLWMGSFPSARAESPLQIQPSNPTATLLLPDEMSVAQTPAFAGTNDEILPGNFNPESPSILALPTPIPGESLVYFATADSNGTATVIFLYNTDSVDHTVALRGFSYSGATVLSLNIVVPATGFLRLTSDPIAASAPPSWETPAPIIANFTDSTCFASLSLPKGVKAEGYTLFNQSTGTVDPNQDQGAIPIRFSSDPASVFLPAVTAP